MVDPAPAKALTDETGHLKTGYQDGSGCTHGPSQILVCA